MGWDIKVWHDDLGDKTRLVIEAGPEVPDEVISAIAGSYWLDEVQYVQDDWDEAPVEPGPPEPGSHFHG